MVYYPSNLIFHHYETTEIAETRTTTAILTADSKDFYKSVDFGLGVDTVLPSYSDLVIINRHSFSYSQSSDLY